MVVCVFLLEGSPLLLPPLWLQQKATTALNLASWLGIFSVIYAVLAGLDLLIGLLLSDRGLQKVLVKPGRLPESEVRLTCWARTSEQTTPSPPFQK